MESRRPSRKRCAIYTRKSSEEGLEQNFNSLDAQREACLAFIQSQKSEGWRPVRTHYDDGGFSGGNVDRPGLSQLLADIEAGKIDTIVVYKVDRLTRSLTDFAGIVDVLDAKGVSFVSVTQQFNTTTSMGRLTLNMLLSFAQFEREVTGERIRDKIAASKRKGLWMGGRVPLGYRAKGRTLEICESEARIVRRIYELYETHGAVTRVTEEICRLGLKTKIYVDKKGRRSGGKDFSRGHVHRVLASPIYAGRIGHKRRIYDGQHPAIIVLETWERVQTMLHAKAPPSSRRGSPSPLKGKLFDEYGAPLTPSHTVKSGRRYRYYVSRLSTPNAASDQRAPAWRLPAGDLEKLVTRAASELISNREKTSDCLKANGAGVASMTSTLDALSTWRGKPFELVQRVDLTPQKLTIELDLSSAVGRNLSPIRYGIPTQTRKRGTERRLVLEKGDTDTEARVFDPALVKVVARAQTWFQAIAQGRAHSFAEIASAEGLSEQYVGKLMPLAFLSPAIVEDTLKARNSVNLTAESLTSRIKIPKDWRGQDRKFRNRS